MDDKKRIDYEAVIGNLGKEKDERDRKINELENRIRHLEKKIK